MFACVLDCVCVSLLGEVSQGTHATLPVQLENPIPWPRSKGRHRRLLFALLSIWLSSLDA